MKIMHVVGYFQPKIGYEEYYLAKSQIEMGHRVLIITSDRYYPFPNYSSIYRNILGSRDSPNIGFHRELGIPTLRLKPIVELDTSILLKNLATSIRTFQPEIIHIHNFFHPLSLQCLLFVKSEFPKRKIIVDVHMIPSFGQSINYPLKTIYFKIFHKFIFQLVKKRISNIYVTKEEAKKYLLEHYKIDIPVIPLGVNTNLFTEKNYNIRKIRDELGLTEDFTLFYSGKIIPRKGLIELIHIFNNLNNKYDVNLLIVGNGSPNYLNLLKKRVKRSLKSKVRILSFVPHEELPKYMAISNLGCWLGSIPSASINEFISIGRPILVKIFEGIDLEKHGHYFAKKYRNIKDSLTWINNLIENKGFYEEQCELARKYALTYLDWKITTKKVMRLGFRLF